VDLHLDVAALFSHDPRSAVGVVDTQRALDGSVEAERLRGLGLLAPRDAREQAAQEVAEASPALATVRGGLVGEFAAHVLSST
jgi:phage head maturation protease